MPLDGTYKDFLEEQFTECDAALVDKPHLAEIFDENWHREHRSKMLNANSPYEIWYPSAYAKPHQALFYPPDYQSRLEEGAAILLPKLDDGEKNHFIKRMRGSGCLSADEELLLARGFAVIFSDSEISFPSAPRDQDIPEFHVSIGRHTLEIEAKGLMDEQEVRELNAHAIESGQLSWVSYSPTIGNLDRLRSAIAKKLLSNTTGDARIVVLTQYTPWINPTEGIPLIRTLATNPAQFKIPDERHALAIAYVTDRWLTGVWINDSVAERLSLSDAERESIRSALKSSFYKRSGDVFFTEQQSENEQMAMIAKMIRLAQGASE